MIRHILVAHEGSDGAMAAFDYGLDLAKKYGAELSVISVVRLPEPPQEVETQAVIEAGKKHFEALAQSLKKRASAKRVPIQTAVELGHPAERIVHWAREHGVDLIILGHHHRSKLGRWLLGGTADKVMDHAACSVIVVKEQVSGR